MKCVSVSCSVLLYYQPLPPAFSCSRCCLCELCRGGVVPKKQYYRPNSTRTPLKVTLPTEKRRHRKIAFWGLCLISRVPGVSLVVWDGASVAVDVAWRLQGLFLATGSLQASTPYLGGVLLAVITTWLFAADSLSKKVRTEDRTLAIPSRAPPFPLHPTPCFFCFMKAGYSVCMVICPSYDEA